MTKMDFELLLQGIKDLNDPAQRAKRNSAWVPLIFGPFVDILETAQGWGLSEIHRKYIEMNPPITDMDISAAASDC